MLVLAEVYLCITLHTNSQTENSVALELFLKVILVLLTAIRAYATAFKHMLHGLSGNGIEAGSM